MGNRKRVAFAAAAVCLAVLAVGCRGPQPRTGTTPPPPPVGKESPPVIVVPDSGPPVVKEGPVAVASIPAPAKPGPPDHAPAHGYRRKHGQPYRFQYHYYPSAYVYYSKERGLYWYMRNGEWEVAVGLPDFLHINVDESVVVKSDLDTPYLEFEAHRAAYPANGGNGKPKGKDKSTKGQGKGKDKGRDGPDE